MNKLALSRRTMLRGVAATGLATVGLPVLEAMLSRTGEAFADGTTPPKRYGVFFWGNGYGWSGRGHADTWTPTGSPSAWTPSEQLAPLAQNTSRVPSVSVITGLEPKTEIPASPGGQGDGHMRGVTNALSADRPRPAGFYHPDHIFALSRPTLDQVIARHPMFVGAMPTRFRSLELSVSNNRFHDYGSWTCISYNGEESQNLPIRSVDALFQHLFGVPVMGSREPGDRVSVLDAVRADAARLRTRLGAADRMRLDAHLEHIGEIQRNLRASAPMCTSPMRPTRAGGFDPDPSNEPLEDKLMAMMQLLAVALQCDLTRVFSMMFTAPGSQTIFRAVGAPSGLHQMCHENRQDIAKSTAIYTMRCFKRVLDLFANTMDIGGRSLLDNMVMLATSEFSAGDQHVVEEFPVLLAGGGGGTLRGGVHYRQAGGNLARVHLTILRALGLPYASYGFNGAETSEPIAEVLV
ncbi:MAG: DUF1552 domain-containing protein [Deltaproteobacteria bacterium]|nr:DUF1552 domain-containing protein [Deltaproteobacteria bacterium]